MGILTIQHFIFYFKKSIRRGIIKLYLPIPNHLIHYFYLYVFQIFKNLILSTATAGVEPTTSPPPPSTPRLKRRVQQPDLYSSKGRLRALGHRQVCTVQCTLYTQPASRNFLPKYRILLSAQEKHRRSKGVNSQIFTSVRVNFRPFHNFFHLQTTLGDAKFHNHLCAPIRAGLRKFVDAMLASTTIFFYQNSGFNSHIFN